MTWMQIYAIGCLLMALPMAYIAAYEHRLLDEGHHPVHAYNVRFEVPLFFLRVILWPLVGVAALIIFASSFRKHLLERVRAGDEVQAALAVEGISLTLSPWVRSRILGWWMEHECEGRDGFLSECAANGGGQTPLPITLAMTTSGQEVDAICELCGTTAVGVLHPVLAAPETRVTMPA